MSKKIEITIWDEDAVRAGNIKDMLCSAMNACCIKGEVLLNCEPPLVARSGHVGRTPIIEFEEQSWECKGKKITQEGISALVARLFMD